MPGWSAAADAVELLGQPFGPTQDRGGVGGLVGGDVDEPLDVVPAGRRQQILRAPHVGLVPLGGMHLQQRQVLQGGRVEHHVGPVVIEHLVDPGRIADVGHDQVGVVQQCPTLQRELHREQRRLVAVQHDQLGRGEATDLAAQLAADRTAGAGDEHPLAGHVVGDRVQVGVDLAPTQQIDLGDRADVAHPDRFTEELGHRGEHPGAQPEEVGPAGHLPDQLAVGRGNGDDQHRGPVLAGHALEVVAGAPHGHTAEPEVLQAGMVVQHGHRRIRAVRVGRHGRDGLVAAVAGTEHDHALGPLFVGPQGSIQDQPPQIPDDPHHHQGDEPAGQTGADRNGMAEGEPVDQRHDRRHHDDGATQRRNLVDGAVPPPVDVEAEAAADHDLGRTGDDGQQRDTGRDPPAEAGSRSGPRWPGTGRAPTARRPCRPGSGTDTRSMACIGTSRFASVTRSRPAPLPMAVPPFGPPGRTVAQPPAGRPPRTSTQKDPWHTGAPADSLVAIEQPTAVTSRPDPSPSDPPRSSRRRTPPDRPQLLAVAAITALAALIGAFADAAPTGIDALDVIYRGAAAAVMVLAASRARRWALFCASGILAVFSTGLMLFFAALAIGIVGALAWFDRRDRVMTAVAGLLLSIVAFRMGSVGFHGLTALAGVAATVPLLISGYRNSRRRWRKVARRVRHRDRRRRHHRRPRRPHRRRRPQRRPRLGHHRSHRRSGRHRRG